MHKFYFFLLVISLVSLLTGCAGNAIAQPEVTAPNVNVAASTQPVVSESTSTCPVTVLPVPPFVPPTPYDSLKGFVDHFWFGSSALWVTLPANGTWYSLPLNPGGYTQKILWWRDGYVWDQEPEPNLIVTGERIDESAPPLVVSKATNAYASDIGSAMLVGVDFPTLGCWKITGNYNSAELSFVIWVAP